MVSCNVEVWCTGRLGAFPAGAPALFCFVSRRPTICVVYDITGGCRRTWWRAGGALYFPSDIPRFWAVRVFRGTGPNFFVEFVGFCILFFLRQRVFHSSVKPEATASLLQASGAR